MPPRLAPGTPLEVRNRAAGDRAEIRTVTRREPRRPVSDWHSTAWWRRHHLDREHDGEWEDAGGFAGERRAAGAVARRGRGRPDSREELRRQVRLARHAQDLRAEAATMGGAEELARYYGRGEFTGRGAGRTERRITGGVAETARARYEAEQAADYAARRRRGSRAVARYQANLRGGE